MGRYSLSHVSSSSSRMAERASPEETHAEVLARFGEEVEQRAQIFRLDPDLVAEIARERDPADHGRVMHRRAAGTT